MAYNYKKLLPASLRTGLWGDFIDALKSMSDDFKEQNIKILLNQFDLDKTTNEQLENIIEKLGWELSVYDGWCSTFEYIKRQILSITTRILYKTTPRAYKDENYIFNIYGTVYPMVRLFEDNSLTPFVEFETSDEQSIALNILDSDGDNLLYYASPPSGSPIYGVPSGSTLLAGYLDTPSVLATLDQFSFTDSVTRGVLFSYEFNVIEDSIYFMHPNSLLALRNDTNQIKKINEKIYFEPTIVIPIGNSGDLKYTIFNSYNGIYSKTQETITQKDKENFSSIQRIELGSGSLTLYSGLPQITSVQCPIYTISSFDTLNYAHTLNPETWIWRKKIFDNQGLPDFTEMAAFDYSGSCLVYSYFPKVALNSGSCYSNIQFKFTYS